MHAAAPDHGECVLIRRFEQQLRTSWRRVVLRQAWQRAYSAAEEGMQVCLIAASSTLHQNLLPCITLACLTQQQKSVLHAALSAGAHCLGKAGGAAASG